MQGTRDSLLLEQDHGFFVYEVWRCSSKEILSDLDTVPDESQRCAPDTIMKRLDDPSDTKDKNDIPEEELDLWEVDLEAESIDNYLRNKVIAMKLINQKIDFLTFDEWAVRYNEVFIPSVPMFDAYSDTGYRFRRNNFNR